nr:dihydroxyacetone kinase subunit DhaL [Flavimaribacter sediminis]
MKALIGAMQAAIAENAERLTALDQAIGDGDHGINMKRGFDAIAADADAICDKPTPQALSAAGMKLVMSVGGASGPLFGTLFMTLGKSLPEDFECGAFADAFAKAVDAVAARGKSSAGQKTMLDVLYPVSDALAAGKSVGEVAAVAAEAAEATVPMEAKRGRASFLGERSIGHMDPGSCSCSLLVNTIAAWISAKEHAA